MDLSTAANIAQVLSIVPLFGGVGLLYHHFKCHHEGGCKKLGHPLHGFRCKEHRVGVDHPDHPHYRGAAA